jgi:NAD+ kinase
MITAIGLVVHSGKTAAIAAADEVRDWSKANGIPIAELDVWTVNGTNGRLDAAAEAARAGEPDLIVTVGGDGTFLRGVRVATVTGALVLGVDVGRVGFLTETSVADLRPSLDKVRDGTFTVDQRLMLTMCASRPLELPLGMEALLQFGRGPALPPPMLRERLSSDPAEGIPLDILALNDVVFEKLARDRQASVAVHVNGYLFGTYSADAVMVSTPTGSTAYSFAAGGPILSPHMDALIFTPVAPHMSFNRSLILGPEERISIEVLKHSGQVAVSADGALRGVLDPGDWITVHAGASPARLARLRKMDFLARVRDRLVRSDALAAEVDGAPA